MIQEPARAGKGIRDGVDLPVTPTAAQPPLPLGRLDANDPTLDADGWVRKVFGYAAFTALFNVSGQPAISLPLGSTPDGLPVGVQLVARYGEEDLLLRVAAQLETAQPWISRIPPVHVG
jgi:amidase